MPLETATYINELVTTNPAASDGMNNADDHMRLIKAAVKTTFPNISGAVTATQAQLNAIQAWSTAGATLLAHAGVYFDNGAGAASTDGFLNTLAGDIDVVLQGNIAATFQRTAGANFFKVNGGIQSTGEIKGPGIPQPGSTMLWWDDVLPDDGLWVWANGQVLANANTVAPILLARWGDRFGGNGTTTMGLPDLRDTVPVGKSTMGGVASRALHTLTNTVLNTLLGLANVALVTANLPPYTPSGGIINGAITTVMTGTNNQLFENSGAVISGGGGSFFSPQIVNPGFSSTQAPSSFIGNAQGGSSTPVNNVQPSTTCNFIIRIG